MKAAGARIQRIYAWLVRVLAPALGEDYTGEAAETFGTLGREARASGLGKYALFLGRELRSLVATAVRTRREARTPGPRGSGQGGPGVTRARGGLLDRLAQDLRYALRNLARAPGFAVITVASLTFAIAVATVVFSVLNAALFRPIPHLPDQEALVHVYSSTRLRERGASSYPDYVDLRETLTGVEGLAAVGSRTFALGRVAEGTRQMWGLEVSENYFQVLGVPLLRGRGFLPEDIRAGGRVVVIGYATWQREFAGAPDVVGRELHLNGHPYTVVGVTPPGVVALEAPVLVEVTVPITDFRDQRGRLWLNLVGRRRAGVGLPQVQAELDAVAGRMVEQYPAYWNHEGDDPRRLLAIDNQRARVPEGVPLGAIAVGVGGLVGLIMLIACSNVTNLLLTRALRRRSEIALRCAIGAPARRIVGQLLVENLLLFGLAGLLGLLLTQWLAAVVQGGWMLLPPPGAEISVDGRVALFTLGVTLTTGLTFGLVPALQASRTDLVPALKGIASKMRFRALGARNLLVGAQVGGSVILVLVTMLLVRGLSHARTLDLGFDPSGVATLSVDLSTRDYGEADGARLYRELLARAEALPGVQAAGLASWVPLAGGSTSYGGLEPEGYEAGPQQYLTATAAVVTPGYLELVRMHLLRGRDFSVEDTPESLRVALVNESFVRSFWPGQGAIGKYIGLGDGGQLEVIGVVADVPYRDLASEIGPHMWLPLAQSYQPDLVLHARTDGDPRALLEPLRRELAALDPNLPVIRADLMENISANATDPHRVLTATLGVAGAFALALAMLGIYGVVGYSVSQRTREMGLRLALGAEPLRVLRMVLGEGVVLSLVGLVPGLLLAAAASRLLRALLLGVSPLDPLAFGGGALLVVLAVMGASLVPGFRASRAHPMESLRAE